jgi:hypothetical protein
MRAGAYLPTLLSLFIDIGQGAGLATSSGARPFLPPLLVGGLARADVGVDFEGTGFEFLENPAFLAAVLALAVVWYVLRRRAEQVGKGIPARTTSGTIDLSELEPPEGKVTFWLEIVLAIGLGAVLFAASLDEGGHEAVIGLMPGLGCAALGYVAMQTLFSGARRRLDNPDQGVAMTALRDVIAIAVAGLSILWGPLGYVALLAFTIYLIAATRSGRAKYKGLRTLR